VATLAKLVLALLTATVVSTASAFPSAAINGCDRLCHQSKGEQSVKKRMLSLVIAIATGAALLTAAPAQAAPTTPVKPASTVRTAALDPATVIAIIKGAYDIYKAFTGGSQSGQAATAQILAAINQAKIDIINHIDAIATAQAKACATEAVIDFADFEVLSPDNKQAFALNTTSCVTLIDSLLGAVVDKAAADQLGFALDSVGPIALIVRSRTGLSNTGLAPILVHGNGRAEFLLKPVCEPVRIERYTEWFCISYNGDSYGPNIPFSVVQSNAGRRTAWAMARAVLPVLTTL
jgi:hypothetical protein